MGLSAAALCLTMAIYYEARDEPLIGQYAVGEVVLNRVADKRFPDTICKVVKQQHNGICQFSFYCDGKPENMPNIKARRQAAAVALAVMYDSTAHTNGALFYHAEYVRPSWRKRLKAVIMIGRHIFYRRKEKRN